MKESSYIILFLSICSFMFAIVSGIGIIQDAVRIERVGIGLLILAIAQAIIAVIAGMQRDEK